jgi:Holliday junction resolvasome RuvABC endonuclease subunit
VRILGIDPGAHVGWCVVDDGEWVKAGVEMWLGFPTVATLLSEYSLHGCHKVAIEEPFVRGGTGPAGWAVGECCKVYGYARGRLEASGIEVVSVAAGDWQKALTGRGRGSKGMSSLVTCAMRDLGVVPKKSNQHQRDAYGVAWYAGTLSLETLICSDPACNLKVTI